jgi:hypothetical protein
MRCVPSDAGFGADYDYLRGLFRQAERLSSGLLADGAAIG